MVFAHTMRRYQRGIPHKQRYPLRSEGALERSTPMDQQQPSHKNGCAAPTRSAELTDGGQRQRGSDASVRQAILRTAGLDSDVLTLAQHPLRQASAGAAVAAAAAGLTGDGKRGSGLSLREKILHSASFDSGSPIFARQASANAAGTGAAAATGSAAAPAKVTAVTSSPAFFIRHFSDTGASKVKHDDSGSSGPTGNLRQQAGDFCSRSLLLRRPQQHDAQKHDAGDPDRLPVLPAKRPAPTRDAAVAGVQRAAVCRRSDSSSPPCAPGSAAESNRVGGGDAPRSPMICGAVSPTLLGTAAAAAALARGSVVGARGGGTPRGPSPRSVADCNRINGDEAPRSPIICGAVSSTAAAAAVAGGSDVGARGGGIPRRPVAESNRGRAGDAPRSPMVCGAIPSNLLATAAPAAPAAVAGGSDVGARGGTPRGPSPRPTANRNRVSGGDAPRSPMICGAVSPSLLGAAAAVGGGNDVGARGRGIPRGPVSGPENGRVGGGGAPRSPMICGAVSLTLLGTAPAAPKPAAETGGRDVGVRGGGTPRGPSPRPVANSNRVGGGDAPRSPMHCGAVSPNLLATSAAPPAPAVTGGSDVRARGGGKPEGPYPGPVANNNRVGRGVVPRSPMICGAVSLALLGKAPAVPAPAAVPGANDVETRSDGMPRRPVQRPVADSNRVGVGDAPRSPMLCGAVSPTILGTTPAVARGSDVGARGGGMPKGSVPPSVAEGKRVGEGDAPRSPMLCGAVSSTLLGAAAAVAEDSNVGARGGDTPRGPSPGPVAESNRVGGGDAPRSPRVRGAVSPTLLGTAAAGAAAVAGGNDVGTRGGGTPRGPSPGRVAESNRVGGGDAPRSPMLCGAVSRTLVGTAAAVAGAGGSDVGARGSGSPRRPFCLTDARSFVLRTAGISPQQVSGAGAGAVAVAGAVTRARAVEGAGAAVAASSSPAMPAAQLQSTANTGAIGSVVHGSVPHLAGLDAWFHRAGDGPGACVGAANLHQAGRHRMLGVGAGAAAPHMPSAARQSAAIGANAFSHRRRPLQCSPGEKEVEGAGEGGEEEEEEEEKEEEEEEEEDDDDDNVKALPPVAVPEGKTLSKHSWCCGRSKELSPPASICSYDIKCPKWQCRYHTHVNNHDKEAFTCCYCEPHLKQGCECRGCKKRVRKAKQSDQVLASYVRRRGVVRAASREFPATVFKFPATCFAESATGVEQQFSVSSTIRQCRVVVTVRAETNDSANCTVSCSGRECQSVLAQVADVSGNERTAADRCEHATVVLGDGAVPRSDIPEAEAILFGEEGEGIQTLAEKALARGCLGQRDASTILRLAQAAVEDGFPLVVRLGDTQSYAVYQADSQYVSGTWAHVRTADVAPSAGLKRSASPGGRSAAVPPSFMCKANRGRPCGTARHGGKKCPHTHIVALAVTGSAYGSTAPANSDDDGGGVDSGDEGVGTGKEEWKRNKSLLMVKVKQLLKIWGAIKFPVNPIPHLSQAGKRGLLEKGSVLSCLEDVCAVCVGPYQILRNVNATALIPGPNLVEVVVCIKGCLKCGTEGATGDDWRETGFFVFGDKLAVHISYLIATRRAVQSGTPITNAWQNVLAPLTDDWEWMEANSFTRKALTNDFLVKKLLDVYLAYEALTDHPYAFSSVVHGFYPLVTSWGNCSAMEVSINLETCIDQRDEHVMDMDCSAVWLALSMLSPMVFSRRLQFSYNMPVAYCPLNRKSNILKLSGRGPAPRSGDVEAGDGGALQEYVEKQDGGLTLKELLDRMTLEELTVLYGKCFGSELPGVSRYPTAVLLRELFERVWDYWQKTHHGKEDDCAKFFLERGLSMTSGVEGEFAIDGVQTCHMFLPHASSPADVAELILHHKHLPILVNTDIMCRLGPILHARCPSAAKDGGALPRIGEANGSNLRTVDIPSLAALGSRSPDVEERGQGQQPVPEEKCTKENAYNVLRDAAPFPSAQQRLDFGQLLDVSARNEAKRDNATQFVHLARSCFRELHRRSHFSIDLFEVVVVLHARITALAALLQDSVVDGGDPPASIEREEEEDLSALLSNTLAYSAFSSSVLAAAVGSTTGEVPTLPSFCGALCQPRRREDGIQAEGTILAYAEAKEDFIAAKLLPDDDSCKTRAVRAVRSGACFGAAVHRVKALQIQLAHGNPGESADEAGKVAGFGLSFNIEPPHDDRPGVTTRQPHPYNGDTDGPYYAPDAAREVSHGVDCRRKYGGLDSCAQLAGIKLKLDDSRKNRYLRMLNVMQFDRFAFTVTLVNEVENEAINRRSLERMVGRFRGHPVERIKVCQAEIWFCGRCFCSKPLLRSFDQFGRVRLSFLPQ